MGPVEFQPARASLITGSRVLPVKVGRRIEQMWIVEEGLKPGDRVAVEWVQQAREGIAVNPQRRRRRRLRQQLVRNIARIEPCFTRGRH